MDLLEGTDSDEVGIVSDVCSLHEKHYRDVKEPQCISPQNEHEQQIAAFVEKFSDSLSHVRDAQPQTSFSSSETRL